MKKAILTIMLCLPMLCMAQTKVKQYIRVFVPDNATGSSISGADAYSKKQLEPIMQGKEKLKFKSDTESINYLAQHGWELVPLNISNGYRYFVRETELTEDVKVESKDSDKKDK